MHQKKHSYCSLAKYLRLFAHDVWYAHFRHKTFQFAYSLIRPYFETVCYIECVNETVVQIPMAV